LCCSREYQYLPQVGVVQRRKGYFLETNFLKGYYEPKVEFLKELGGEEPNQNTFPLWQGHRGMDILDQHINQAT